MLDIKIVIIYVCPSPCGDYEKNKEKRIKDGIASVPVWGLLDRLKVGRYGRNRVRPRVGITCVIEEDSNLAESCPSPYGDYIKYLNVGDKCPSPHGDYINVRETLESVVESRPSPCGDYSIDKKEVEREIIVSVPVWGLH